MTGSPMVPGPDPTVTGQADYLTAVRRLALDGGIPVRTTPWPTYDKGAVDVDTCDEEATLRAVRSHLYFRYDCRPPEATECGQLEQDLCRYFGSRHALATSSGTTAL